MPRFKRWKQSSGAPPKSAPEGEDAPETDVRALLRAALATDPSGGGAASPTLPLGLGSPVMWSGVSIVLVAVLLFAFYLAPESGDDAEGSLVANPTSVVPAGTDGPFISDSPTPSTGPTEPPSTPLPTVPPAGVTCEGGQDAFEYEVKPGDSVATIAADSGLFEGDIVICDSSIQNPALIRPGQVMRIPCPDEGCP